MIRFVSLGHQLDDWDKNASDFAFYDTNANTFCEWDRRTVFETVDEFILAFKESEGNGGWEQNVCKYLSKIPQEIKALHSWKKILNHLGSDQRGEGEKEEDFWADISQYLSETELTALESVGGFQELTRLRVIMSEDIHRTKDAFVLAYCRLEREKPDRLVFTDDFFQGNQQFKGENE